MAQGSRSWRSPRPLDLYATLGTLRRGARDPAFSVGPDGAVWRALRGPDGPATLRIAVRAGEGRVEASAWGSGAGWALESAPGCVGEDDDPAGFAPRHPVLVEAARRHRGWRVPRTGLVLEALVPAILEQKVTGTEARRAWRDLLLAYGEPAPGPGADRLRVPPSAAGWRRVPSWDWHRAGVDGSRSGTVLRAAAVAGRLEETLGLSRADGAARLRQVPGVGAWTVAEVRQRAHGDPDAVSVGDFHLPALVGCALAGQPVDDDGMLELLEPYAGHRYRAVRLVELSGVRVPRRGPRLSPRDFRRS